MTMMDIEAIREAFGRIVLTRDSSYMTLAHEIGHSFGMSDIYDKTDDGRTIDVDFCYYCAMDDWNGGCQSGYNRRYYRSALSQDAILARLLMSGKCDDGLSSSAASNCGIDITAGGVGGCWYEEEDNRKVWNVTARPSFDVAPIGAFKNGRLELTPHE